LNDETESVRAAVEKKMNFFLKTILNLISQSLKNDTTKDDWSSWAWNVHRGQYWWTSFSWQWTELVKDHSWFSLPSDTCCFVFGVKVGKRMRFFSLVYRKFIGGRYCG
jgi:hypothetical protein